MANGATEMTKFNEVTTTVHLSLIHISEPTRL